MSFQTLQEGFAALSKATHWDMSTRVYRLLYEALVHGDQPCPPQALTIKLHSAFSAAHWYKGDPRQQLFLEALERYCQSYQAPDREYGNHYASRDYSPSDCLRLLAKDARCPSQDRRVYVLQGAINRKSYGKAEQVLLYELIHRAGWKPGHTLRTKLEEEFQLPVSTAMTYKRKTPTNDEVNAALQDLIIRARSSTTSPEYTLLTSLLRPGYPSPSIKTAITRLCDAAYASPSDMSRRTLWDIYFHRLSHAPTTENAETAWATTAYANPDGVSILDTESSYEQACAELFTNRFEDCFDDLVASFPFPYKGNLKQIVHRATSKQNLMELITASRR